MEELDEDELNQAILSFVKKRKVSAMRKDAAAKRREGPHPSSRPSR